MLKINKSLRLNRRYLLVEGDKEDIEKAILDYTGVLGWAKASVMFVKKTDGKWIVAVNREEIVNVRAAFAIFHKKLNVLRVSGTLKGLSK